MPNIGIVPIRQDPGIWERCGKEISGPIYRGPVAITILMGPREGDESPGLGPGLQGTIASVSVNFQLIRVTSLVRPRMLRVAGEAMQKDNTRMVCKPRINNVADSVSRILDRHIL